MIRDVSNSMKDEIKEALKKERLEYTTKHCPHMLMIGIHQGVCSDVTIEDICSNADNIVSVEELDYFLLCPELKSHFFIVLMDIIRNAPPVKQRRRH